MIALQKSFAGGMDQINDETKIADDAYKMLVNARQRFNRLDPIPKHVLQSAPAGKKQAVRAVGNVLVIFVAGSAYYRIDGAVGWIKIPDFSMDATEDQYFTEAVPASTFNFTRKNNTDSANNPITVEADFQISGTPAGILVQDTINQPWIILFDEVNNLLTARVTKGYNDWQNVSEAADDREYVPIGRQMMYKDAILYIVARNKKSVMRSITGRPLDFMVNVDSDGNKLPSEVDGGAITVSFAFDFDDITCLQPLNIPDAFVYGTPHSVRIATADYTNTIFGEPTFRVAAIIASGIVNQYSFTEILGSYAFIDKDTAKMFDAVQQLTFKGRNSIFSLQLSKLLKTQDQVSIKQQDCSIVQFNNYALFNLDTHMGNLMAVYDTLLEKWIGIDVTEVSRVKQFTLLETLEETKLFCITKDDECWQMFASTDDTYIPILFTKSFIEGESAVEHSSEYFKPVFDDASDDGVATLIEVVDNQYGQTDQLAGRLEKPIIANLAGIPYPVVPPVFPCNKRKVNSPLFQLTTGLVGKKLSYILIWDNDAKLLEFEVRSKSEKSPVTSSEKSKVIQDTYGS